MNSVLKGVAVLAVAATMSGAAFAAEVASGDAVRGEKIFKKCQACHTIEEGGPDRVGPNLHNVMERGIAAKEGYNYSPAMKKFAKTGAKWTEETLFTYLKKPRDLVPGTYMSFPGLKKAQDRDDLLAYLEKASGHDDKK